MLPEPLAGQLEPADALQVHDTPVKIAGNVSVTVAAVTLFGPLLVTVIVYDAEVPGTSAANPSSLVMPRSASTGVLVGVFVGVAVLVGVGVIVGVRVGVNVGVKVNVGVLVGVLVGVDVGVNVGVNV